MSEERSVEAAFLDAELVSREVNKITWYKELFRASGKNSNGKRVTKRMVYMLSDNTYAVYTSTAEAALYRGINSRDALETYNNAEPLQLD